MFKMLPRSSRKKVQRVSEAQQLSYAFILKGRAPLTRQRPAFDPPVQNQRADNMLARTATGNNAFLLFVCMETKKKKKMIRVQLQPEGLYVCLFLPRTGAAQH